jgi:hypothetical protein
MSDAKPYPDAIIRREHSSVGSLTGAGFNPSRSCTASIIAFGEIYPPACFGGAQNWCKAMQT